MFRRNSKLITPPDFDYSPYFEIIKYPMLDFDELAVYKKLPWDRSGVHCSTVGDCFVTDPSVIDRIQTAERKSDEDRVDETEAKKNTSLESIPGTHEPSNNEPWDDEPHEDDLQNNEPWDRKSNQST